MITLFEMGLVAGLVAVASNPSPFFAALGLVCGAGAGCLLLSMDGASFLPLVLFLIYLGGMMVVFGYSAALVAEPYPEAWGNIGVMCYLVIYMILLGLWWKAVGGAEKIEIGVSFNNYMGDWFGVCTILSSGGWFLLVLGWALLLTLFGVLEVVRGHYWGVLRAV